ncbi:MAG: hypothetical protein ACRC0V_09375 [Fusobacteriaceae bacterium]
MENKSLVIAGGVAAAVMTGLEVGNMVLGFNTKKKVNKLEEEVKKEFKSLDDKTIKRYQTIQDNYAKISEKLDADKAK